MLISKAKLYLGSDPLSNAKLLLPKDPIYSFFLRKNQQYELIYYVSDCQKYNTLKPENVLNLLKGFTSKSTGILCFGQPSIDIMIELFDPYMMKLASDVMKKYKSYEFDDLFQECRVCAIELYNKGYYLNKALIATAFKNHVIDKHRWSNRLCRVEEDTLKLLSEIAVSGISDEDLTFEDVTEDPEFRITYEEEMHRQSMHDIYEEVKQYIVQSIGLRGFEQLEREITTGYMSEWGRRHRRKLTEAMLQDGLTKDFLYRKHYWR